MFEELDRLTTTFSDIIRDQARQLDQGMDILSAAFDQAVERFAALIPGAAASVTVPSNSTATISTASVLHVHVVNEELAVRIIGQGRTESRTGLFGTILGGIGSLFGNLIGGILGGFASPITNIINLAELIILAGRITELVQEIGQIAERLTRSIRELILQLFRELRTAGIFPVSRLIASLLLLIDVGITLILTHIQPVIVWAQELLGAITTWLGEFINRLGNWLAGVLNRLPVFFRDLILYLSDTALKPMLDDIIQTVVRPAVDQIINDAIRSLTSALIGAFTGLLIGLGNVIIESARWMGEWLAYSIGSVLDELPFVEIDVSRPEALGDRLGRAIRQSFAEGQEFGRIIAEELFPRAPRTPSPTQTEERRARPRFRIPGFQAPELELPELPAPSPQLNRILEIMSGRPAPSPAPEEAAPISEPVTLNGGIHIQINPQTIDQENAGETAQLIADRLMEELQRLTELERFRRGLPAESVV